jgi:hypothetical protein
VWATFAEVNDLKLAEALILRADQQKRIEQLRQQLLRNLAFRVVLESCALAALGYGGFKTGRGPVTRIGLGIGAPLLGAAVWGAFVAPRAPVAVPAPVRLARELAVFGSAVAALYAVGRPSLAWTLAIAYVTNRALMAVWGQ